LKPLRAGEWLTGRAGGLIGATDAFRAERCQTRHLRRPAPTSLVRPPLRLSQKMIIANCDWHNNVFVPLGAAKIKDVHGWFLEG